MRQEEEGTLEKQENNRGNVKGIKTQNRIKRGMGEKLKDKEVSNGQHVQTVLLEIKNCFISCFLSACLQEVATACTERWRLYAVVPR